MAEARPLAERSLRALADECPWHFDALGRTLAGVRIAVRIGDERFGVVVVDGITRIVNGLPDPTAELWCDQAALRALLVGWCTPLETLECGSADVRAAIDVLLVLADALRIFLAGALRSPAHVRLLERIQGKNHDKTSEEHFDTTR